MKIEILNSTHDLGKDSRPYYDLFHDVRGNFFQAVLQSIDIYDLKKDESYMLKAKEQAQLAHSRFNKVINQVLDIMKLEKVEGRLFDLVKRLKKESNFDWTDLGKFDKFDKVYVEILDQLKKL